MDSRQQTLYYVHILFFMSFNKATLMYYTLFAFRFYYKIIIFSKFSGPRAYPSLARGYGPGLGLKDAVRAGPGPNINGLGRAWAKILVCGHGLDEFLRAWAGPGF